jgi:signal transduction histidine kinase
MLTDAQGRIVYTCNEAQGTLKLGRVLEDRKSFIEGQKDIYFSDVYFDKNVDNQFEMLGLAPVLARGGNFIGEIVIEMDMGPIYKFIRETTGLGVTGEALIDRKEGNEVLFLSPINNDPAAALKKKAAFNDRAAYAAQKAAQGETGSGVATDYQGTEVLAAWRYLPSLRWGLVTKINAVEAFAPVRQLRNIFLFVGIIMTFLGVAAAALISRAIARPVHDLQKGAEAIAAGDLSQRVGTVAHDEIGRLSRAFDVMTESLQRDIAGRKRAEEEVRALNEDLKHHVRQLEESNRELEAFSYSVSHDLRSPLRSIVGFSQALLEDYQARLDAEGRDFLNRIVAATVRMGQLIDDLLKLSRIARMELKREQVDLSSMAATIVARIQEAHPEREAKFVIAPGLTASGDERLLSVVLENLFANAWKFSEKSTATVIEFGANQQGEDTEYFVKDNGAGFDMAYAGKLFSPFQRLHKVEQFSGTGIGLATVKRIISRHGGRVRIEGEVGKGTTVYFTL